MITSSTRAFAVLPSRWCPGIPPLERSPRPGSYRRGRVTGVPAEDELGCVLSSGAGQARGVPWRVHLRDAGGVIKAAASAGGLRVRGC